MNVRVANRRLRRTFPGLHAILGVPQPWGRGPCRAAHRQQSGPRFRVCCRRIRLLAGDAVADVPVTTALVLGCGQLVTAARIYERLRFLPTGPFYHLVHRWSGRAAIVFTLPAAYHCIFMLGFGSETPRVLIHSLLGSALYGAVVVKVLMVRSSRFAGWALPVAGGLLFAILLGLWLTSALLFFAGGLSAP